MRGYLYGIPALICWWFVGSSLVAREWSMTALYLIAAILLTFRATGGKEK